jgi:hypothetical protein
MHVARNRASCFVLCLLQFPKTTDDDASSFHTGRAQYVKRKSSHCNKGPSLRSTAAGSLHHYDDHEDESLRRRKVDEGWAGVRVPYMPLHACCSKDHIHIGRAGRPGGRPASIDTLKVRRRCGLITGQTFCDAASESGRPPGFQCSQ